MGERENGVSKLETYIKDIEQSQTQMKKKSSKIDKDLIKAKSILQLILDDKE